MGFAPLASPPSLRRSAGATRNTIRSGYYARATAVQGGGSGVDGPAVRHGCDRPRRGAIVVPNANTAAPGDSDNRFPFLVTGGMRYQEVYASSQFSAFGGTPQLITEIDLRNGVFVNEAFTATIPNITISLSTDREGARRVKAATFADNLGPGQHAGLQRLCSRCPAPTPTAQAGTKSL